MNLSLPSDRRVIRNLTGIGLPEIPLFGAYKLASAELALPPHTHGEYIEIHYIKRGLQTFNLHDQLHTLRKNDLFITLPNEEHGTGASPLQRGTIYWLQLHAPKAAKSLVGLNPGMTGRLLEQLRSVPARHFHATPLVAELFEDIFQLLNTPDSPARNSGITTRLALWLQIVAECAHTPRNQAVTADIKSILNLIDKDASCRLTVAALAAKLGFSVASFQRRFQSQTGVSPHHYILDRKIARAATLLLTTQQEITRLANDLGFSSSQHFATVFKNYTGLTPLAYRNRTYPKRNYPAEERVIMKK